MKRRQKSTSSPMHADSNAGQVSPEADVETSLSVDESLSPSPNEISLAPPLDYAEGRVEQRLISWEKPEVKPGTPARADPRVVAFFEQQQAIDLMPNESLSVLARDYVEERFPSFSPQGALVTSPMDAAAIFSVLRSPYVERLSWILVNEEEGAVVGGGLHAVGDQTGTESFSSTSSWRPVKLAIDRHRGKQLRLYVAHNHPTGDPDPSPADHVVYRGAAHAARRDGVSFTGLVLNGDRFSLMRPHMTAGAMSVTTDAPLSVEQVPYSVSSPWKMASPNLSVSTPEMAANVARLIRHSPDAMLIIWLNARSQAHAIQSHPGAPSPDFLDSTAASLACERFTLVGGAAALKNIEDFPTKSYPTGLVDVVRVNDDGSVSSLRRMASSWSTTGMLRKGVAKDGDIPYNAVHQAI